MPQINYDAMTDTLSVSRNGEQHHTVCPAVHDSHILLSLTAENECIAVEVMGAKAIVPERWWTHPDRSEIPLDLLTEIDMWVRIPLVWAELPLLTSIFEPESLVLGDHPLSWKEEIADAQFKHIYNTVPANTRIATGDDAQYAIRGCEHGVLDCCWTLSLFLEHEKTSPKCQRLREVYKDTLLPRLRAAYLYLALSGGPQTIMSASDDFVQFFLSSSSKGDQNPIEIKRSFLETYMETQVGRSRLTHTIVQLFESTTKKLSKDKILLDVTYEEIQKCESRIQVLTHLLHAIPTEELQDSIFQRAQKLIEDLTLLRNQNYDLLGLYIAKPNTYWTFLSESDVT